MSELRGKYLICPDGIIHARLQCDPGETTLCGHSGDVMETDQTAPVNCQDCIFAIRGMAMVKMTNPKPKDTNP